MKYGPLIKKTKNGIEVEFRSADPENASAMIAYLKRCCGETRYLLSEPEDIEYTEDSERNFLSDYEKSENSLMLNAYIDGMLVGNGSFAPVSNTKRQAHRCSMGIALFREFCGQGIGELLLSILIDEARMAGFEIMELDVVTTNTNAIRLYEKLGFKKYGERGHAFKYKDGTYADEYLMAKDL